MPELELTDCWLAAGALFQTVWNALSGRDPQAGILDYDLNYFDSSGLSWEAEDRAITAAAAVLGGIEANIQIRNAARVHLWYEQKFGVPCPLYRQHQTCDLDLPQLQLVRRGSQHGRSA